MKPGRMVFMMPQARLRFQRQIEANLYVAKTEAKSDAKSDAKSEAKSEAKSVRNWAAQFRF
jgi:hypothetical protein